MKRAVNHALKAMARITITAGMFGLLAVNSSQAQSSVQLYGLVDEWVGATKFPGGQSAVNVGGGGMSTSY